MGVKAKPIPSPPSVRPGSEALIARERSVLIVSPHFPPSTMAGVHRARHLAKHLPSHGWRPIVIRADERHYTEASDPALAALVPESVLQIRTEAVPARLARLVGIGDIGLRTYLSITRAVAAAITSHAPQAILITGSPFYPMLMAGWIQQRWNVPVVLDFQDPWVSADGAQRPWWSKARMAHRIAVALEPRAVRAASWITSVSDTQNADMMARYPWLDARRMSAIPIGGDPADFAALRATPLTGSRVTLEADRINFCYVGTFLPHAGPVVRTLFEAVALLRRERPALAQRTRFVFVGTSNQPSGKNAATPLVSPIANAVGVADLVREHPMRVSFLEALALLTRANGVLLIGSDEPHYTASKIYPGLMSGRPHVSIFHARSSSHEILTRAGGGKALAFSDTAQLATLVPTIADCLARLAENPESFGFADTESYAPYTADAVAGQFARVFERARSE